MSPIIIFQNAFALLITLLLWGSFLFSSAVLFFFFQVPSYLFSKDHARSFQKFTHINLKIFFSVTCLLIPRTKFKIPEEILQIKSSVVVCNHLSYLDPILLISLFKRNCTIVKSTFFRVPFFGWLLKNSHYMPSAASELGGEAMVENLEKIKEHLGTGGNFFVFPEGTRSRDGKLAAFNKGVFSIARYCNAPLALLYIKNTNKLFRPGSFLLNTSDDIEIELELIWSLTPDYKSNNFSISAVADEARKIYEQNTVF